MGKIDDVVAWNSQRLLGVVLNGSHAFSEHNWSRWGETKIRAGPLNVSWSLATVQWAKVAGYLSFNIIGSRTENE